MATNANTAIAATATLKIHPFMASECELWFAQLERQFVHHNITDDNAKFITVESNLNFETTMEVKDVLENPPTTNKYQALKEKLTKRLSRSRDEKIRQLLTNEAIGDRKPSQFLRHLKSLAGSTVSDDIIRTIWVDRLPKDLQPYVATMDNVPLDQVAESADKMQAISRPQECAVAAASSKDGVMEELIARLDRLTRTVEELKKDGRPTRDREQTTRSDSRRRRSRSRNKPTRNDWCFFHNRFGAKAMKCESPCAYQKN